MTNGDGFRFIERARVAFNLGKYAQAELEVRKHLALCPEDVDGITLLAACRCNLGGFKEAQQLAGRALSLNPLSAYANYVLAAACLSQGQVIEAELAIEEALRLEPDSCTYLVFLAAILPLGAPRGLELARQALALEPHSLPAMQQLYLRLLYDGRLTAAESVLQDLLARYPENALVHEQVAWHDLDSPERVQEAIEHFQESLRLNPNRTSSMQGLLQARSRSHAASALLNVVPANLGFYCLLLSLTVPLAYLFSCLTFHHELNESHIAGAILLPIAVYLVVLFFQMIVEHLILLSRLRFKNERHLVLARLKNSALACSIGAIIGLLVVATSDLFAGRPLLLVGPSLGFSLVQAPSWLYCDWRQRFPGVGSFAPLLLFTALSLSLSSALSLFRHHLQRRPMSTDYFRRLLVMLCCLGICLMFVAMALFKSVLAVYLTFVAATILIFCLVLNPVVLSYVKAAIARDAAQIKD
ncbi:MAG: tetratricopeptide repeat protein [Candidatus Obscuribacter sp.]|nr:tetratricopeptide repeat protein [Candidatus Obscuribacter sp.]MBK9277393.1 tetratricopeptide repeat protein [Candidatus Obscuribacter sp.]